MYNDLSRLQKLQKLYFSQISALEGQFFIKRNISLSLSEQEVIDCAVNAVSCTVTSMQQVYDHIKENGISTYESYPYDAQLKVCRRGTDSGVRITGYAEIPRNEQSLKQAVGEYSLVTFSEKTTITCEQSHQG